MQKSERLYELRPTDGTRKSFYGKALIVIGEDGSETLLSYLTPIIRRNADGSFVRLYTAEPSATTWRHIKAFADITKKEWDKLSTSKEA